MDKYDNFISAINNGLNEFSKYLNSNYKISLFDDTNLKDPKVAWNLIKDGWHETQFPNGSSPGVYFIFGRRKEDENILGVYIGKASHNSLIGKRLYSHLSNAERENKIYPMRDKIGNVFLLEYVITISMDEIYFLAPALEEFLIYYLQDEKLNLINAVGLN